MAQRKNLLIAFDAFGTLFKPKRPIAQQYGEVARSLGLTGFGDEDVEREFRDAFKKASQQNPNYGKASKMNATKWWTNIIEETFIPLVGPNAKILDELAPRLIYRFATEEGYSVFPDAVALLRNLPKNPQADDGRIVVGVITNSDNRVPDVLTSLGLRVGPFRYGRELIKSPAPSEMWDVDFCVMSYDVGAEKPERRMFDAAEEMLARSPQGAGTDLAAWSKVYVGDNYGTDVVGAVNAGWNAVLIDRELREKSREIEWLDDRPNGQLNDMFKSSKAVAFSNLVGLAEWLPKSP